jgi:hypothetical protein
MNKKLSHTSFQITVGKTFAKETALLSLKKIIFIFIFIFLGTVLPVGLSLFVGGNGSGQPKVCQLQYALRNIE